MRRSYQYFLRSVYDDLGVTVPPARLMDIAFSTWNQKTILPDVHSDCGNSCCASFITDLAFEALLSDKRRDEPGYVLQIEVLNERLRSSASAWLSNGHGAGGLIHELVMQKFESIRQSRQNLDLGVSSKIDRLHLGQTLLGEIPQIGTESFFESARSFVDRGSLADLLASNTGFFIISARPSGIEKIEEVTTNTLGLYSTWDISGEWLCCIDSHDKPLSPQRGMVRASITGNRRVTGPQMADWVFDNLLGMMNCVADLPLEVYWLHLDTPAPPCWTLPSVATWFMPASSTFTNSGMSAMPEPNASHDPDPTHEVVCTYVFQKEQKAGQQESFLLEFMLILFPQNVDQIYH